MLENSLNLKTTVIDPFFGSEKWNKSIDKIKHLENIFSTVNKNFKGFYDDNKEYRIGDYIFFEKNCYEMTNDSTEHFSEFTPSQYYYLNNEKKLTLNGKTLSENTFDYISYNDSTKEVLCIENSNIYLYDKDLKTLNLNNTTKITSTVFDEYSIYISLGRKIIKKERNNESLEQNEIFKTNLLIKNIALNSKYLFLLLSDGSVKKIDRANNEVIESIQTNIIFSNNVKCVSYSSKKLFILNDDKLYTFSIKDEISKVSEFNHTLLKNNCVDFSKYSNYLFIRYQDGSVVSTKTTLNAMKKTDFSKLLIKDTLVSPKNILSSIMPRYNLISSESINLKLDNFKLLKDKGLEINSEKTSFVLKDDLINKCICIISNSLEEDVNENYLIKINQNKQLVLNINKTGNKKIFLNIFDNYAYVYIYHNGEIVKDRLNITNLISIEQTLEIKSNNSFILEEVHFFNKKLEKIEMDFYSTNQIQPSDSNNKDFLPFSLVKCNYLGIPQLKIANETLTNDEDGLKVNLSDEYKTLLNDKDKEKSFSIYGAKKLFEDFKNEFVNSNEIKANKNHYHNWSDILEVPMATTEDKGIVILNNDPLETTSKKVATPYMVNEVKKIINKEINDNVLSKVTVLEKNLDNINQNVLPNFNESLQTIASSIGEKIKDFNTSLNKPNNFLDKSNGGKITADVSIQNIDFSNNIIKFKKDSNSSVGVYFGNYGFMKHEVSESGIDTFKIASTIYKNDSSGGIDIGYLQNNSFYKTAFISSSGNGSFNLINSASDINVARDVRLVGDVYITSDKRLKREIKKVENPSEKIMKINGYTFYKIGFSEKTAGIIAQEVRDAFPELVHEKNNKLEVNYNGLHSLEIEVIKELLNEVNFLKKEIESIKNNTK